MLLAHEALVLLLKAPLGRGILHEVLLNSRVLVEYQLRVIDMSLKNKMVSSRISQPEGPCWNACKILVPLPCYLLVYLFLQETFWPSV